MLSGAELSEALSVLEPGEEVALWSAAGAGGSATLTRALLAGGARAAPALAAAPAGAARALLRAAEDALQGPPRRTALAALAAMLALRPAWLAQQGAGLAPLGAALARAARHEDEPLPLLHALLALVALLGAAPPAASALWPHLAGALLRPSALQPAPAPAAAAQLQLAQLALFHSLYCTHPCSLVDALRGELAASAGSRALFERDVAPLLRAARLQPALLTGSRQQEAEAGRWARAELHDVLAEAHELQAPAPPPPASPPPPPEPAPPDELAPGCAARAARGAPGLRPDADGWIALGELAQGAPATPQPEPEPEAAVEATPENTPAREARRFPGAESGAVRSVGLSPPPEGAAGGRLLRVLAERRALQSPVALAAAAPAGAARPEPRAPLEPPERAALLATLAPAALAPRSARRPAARLAQRPAPRAHSLPPRGAPHSSVAVQTTERWPEPYEFLIADFYNSLPDDTAKSANEPSDRLEEYLSGGDGAAVGEGQGDGELLQAALQFERWRREAHAERNRRLQGRVRAARAAELQLRQLRARVADLAAERDQLRRRLQRAPPVAPVPTEREQRLHAQLQHERALRVRAEAARAEAEAALERCEAEQQSAASEDDLQLQALARAAAAAGPSQRHARRLQQRLLALGEREQRRGCVSAGGGDERVLRAAAARAEAELASAAARADAAAARSQELEATLAARDAALAELRRGARAAALEHAARARALSDKYEALLRVLRAGAIRSLRARAQDELAPPLPRAVADTQ